MLPEMAGEDGADGYWHQQYKQQMEKNSMVFIVFNFLPLFETYKMIS